MVMTAWSLSDRLIDVRKRFSCVRFYDRARQELRPITSCEIDAKGDVLVSDTLIPKRVQQGKLTPRSPVVSLRYVYTRKITCISRTKKWSFNRHYAVIRIGDRDHAVPIDKDAYAKALLEGTKVRSDPQQRKGGVDER